MWTDFRGLEKTDGISMEFLRDDIDIFFNSWVVKRRVMGRY